MLGGLEYGFRYKLKYSAEEHPAQSDMLNILGTVINRIIEKHQEDESGIDEAINTICIEAPEELKRLDKALESSKI